MARVVELLAGDPPVTLDLTGEAREPLDVVVGVYPGLAGAPLARGLNVGCGGHDQPESPLCAHADPARLILGHAPIGKRLVRCHRREDDAAPESGAAREAHGLEQSNRHSGKLHLVMAHGADRCRSWLPITLVFCAID